MIVNEKGGLLCERLRRRKKKKEKGIGMGMGMGIRRGYLDGVEV